MTNFVLTEEERDEREFLADVIELYMEEDRRVLDFAIQDPVFKTVEEWLEFAAQLDQNRRTLQDLRDRLRA